MSELNMQRDATSERKHSGFGNPPELNLNHTIHVIARFADEDNPYGAGVLTSKGKRNDRRNLFRTSARDFLLHQGSGRTGEPIRACSGLLRAGKDERRPEGSVHAQQRATAWSDVSGSDQRGINRRLTFPIKVQLAVGAFIALFMGAGFAVGTFIGWAMQIGVSHLSGFWWLIGGAAAYIAFCLFMFSNFQVAGSSDRDIAEMGGPR